MPEYSRPVSLMLRLLGGFTLLLVVGVTRPLWLARPTVLSPQIPWLSILSNIPFFVDQALYFGMVIASVWLLFGHTGDGNLLSFNWLYIVCLTGLVLLDQHRLQPWILQFLLFAIVLALSPNSLGLRYCRWLVASIYIYSAVSKFDASFLQSHGQLLLSGLLKPFGQDMTFWSQAQRQLVVLMFPIGEFLTALLILSHKWRRVGTPFAISMHLTLMLILGPLGLNHEYGVLIWNIYFIAINVVLSKVPLNQSEEPVNKPLRARLTTAITIIAVALPALESFGLYDHWPAWAVYCSRPEKVDIYVSAGDVAQLDPKFQHLFGDPEPLSTEVPLLLDRWAFQQRHCPLYPQLRYRLALAHSFLQAANIPADGVRIEIGETPHRITGQRELRVLTGMPELEQELQSFRINTSPRRTSWTDH